MKNQFNPLQGRASRGLEAAALFALAGATILLAVACDSSNDNPSPTASTGTVNPVGGTVATTGAGGATSSAVTSAGGTGQGGMGQGGKGQGGSGQGGSGGSAGGLPGGVCTPYDNSQLPNLGPNGTLPPLP